MGFSSPIAKFLLGLASFIVVVAGMRAAASLLVPFLLSLFIAVVCSPPLIWLKHKGIPSALAMLIVIAVIVVGGILVGVIVGSSVNDFRADIPEYQQRLSDLSENAFAYLGTLGVDLDDVRSNFNPAAALSLAGNTLASFGNLMTNAFLILLTVIFILAEEVGFADKLRQCSKDAEETIEAISQFTHAVNRYVAIKSLMSVFTGIIIMVWLWFLGVDYFILWGLLAFMLNFVPTLGSIIAAVPAVLLSLVQLGPADAVAVAAGFVLVNFGMGNVLEPRMMGKGLNLSTLVVFLSLVFWGWVLGPVGMLLSIPLTVTVKIALERFEDTRWIGVMLGSGQEVSVLPSDLLFLDSKDTGSK